MGKENAGLRWVIPILAWVLSLAPLAAEPPPQPVAFRVGSLLFDRPEGWKWVQPEGSLRVAQLEKTGPGKTPLVMAFSRFPAGSGGTAQANVDRWVRQFSQTSTPAEIQSSVTKAGTLTRVHIRGSLRGGIPGGPEKDIPDALLLGAILETEGGMIVVKLAGPASALTGEEKTFTELISNAADKNSNP